MLCYLPHNNYKKYRKRRVDLTETLGAYKKLGLLELLARAALRQLKKRWRKVEDGKIHLSRSLLYKFELLVP